MARLTAKSLIDSGAKTKLLSHLDDAPVLFNSCQAQTTRCKTYKFVGLAIEQFFLAIDLFTIQWELLGRILAFLDCVSHTVFGFMG